MIYTNQTKYNLFFACTIIVFFLIDLGQFFLMGTIIIPLLLCIYCTLLLPLCSSPPKSYAEHGKTSPFIKTLKKRSVGRSNNKWKDKSEDWHIYLGIIAFLQCLEFFCFYSSFFLAYVFIIPTTVLAIFFKKNLYPSLTNVATLALISSLIQIYAAEGYLLPLWPTFSYTIMRISATLLVTICFSLTINIWGMQGNRA